MTRSLSLPWSRPAILAATAALVTAIALADWLVVSNVSLGFLYLFPILLGACVLPRWQIVGLAVACTLLRETFSSFHWGPDALPRVSMVAIAFAGTGLFIAELSRNRRLAVQHLADIEQQIKLREDAEEQLRVLIDSSPAAILTVDGQGRILIANRAAQDLFASGDRPLSGVAIGSMLPAIAAVPLETGSRPSFRTVMQCRGERHGGEVFPASVSFSTYRTHSGPRLAAIVLDGSEDLRDREELNLHRLQNSTHILVGALCHEIRNLCGGIGAVRANLSHVAELSRNPDFQALGTLVEGLEKIASTELRPSEPRLAGVEVAAVLEELRIVLGPAFREAQASLAWQIAPELPRVWADHHALLQVFLNLANNSLRAMEAVEQRQLAISARRAGGRVAVRFQDSGAGVAQPELLFRPFQRGAEAAGLGLYVSRAIVRSFEGDLRYEPQAPGAAFVVELSAHGGRE